MGQSTAAAAAFAEKNLRDAKDPALDGSFRTAAVEVAGTVRYWLSEKCIVAQIDCTRQRYRRCCIGRAQHLHPFLINVLRTQ